MHTHTNLHLLLAMLMIPLFTGTVGCEIEDEQDLYYSGDTGGDDLLADAYVYKQSACKVDYDKSNDWGTGFVGRIKLTNRSTKSIAGWKLTWSFPGNQSISSSWSAKLNQSGRRVTTTPLSWNRTIYSGDSVELGFTANYSGKNRVPSDFRLNGQPCNESNNNSSSDPPNVATKKIPRPLKLWVLDNHNVAQFQWSKYLRWYEEKDGKIQLFNLHKGDKTLRGDGKTWHARIEVHSGLEFQPGDGWHVFEATYQIDTNLKDDVAIAQMFDYSKVHPQIMFIFKDGHRVTYQSRGKGNKELGTGYRNKPFTIKMRSNGTDEKVYFNGALRYSGKVANRASSARNGFRWGLYYGGIAPADVHSKVTQVTRKKE